MKKKTHPRSRIDITSRRIKPTIFYSLLPASEKKKLSIKHARIQKNKSLNSPCHKLVYAKRVALNQMITDKNTYSKYLSFNRDELIVHLEKQFVGRMSWKNYGRYWELDHIIPIKEYYSNIELDSVIWELNNLRPLLRKTNRERAYLV